MISKFVTAAVLGAAMAMVAAPAVNAQSGGGGPKFSGGAPGFSIGGGPKFSGGGGPKFSGSGGGPRFSGGGGGGPKFSGGGGSGRKFSGGGGGGRKFSGGGRHGGGGKHVGRRGGYRYGYGVGVPYYFDSYSFIDDDNECSYLWRRYKRTGNPKWKYRYYDCID